MNEVWWVNAFAGEGAGGNATCVVFDDDPQSKLNRANVAQALRAPDTAFVRQGREALEIEFFSPFEGAMAFCGQGFIAADAVLRRARTVSGPIEFRARTGVVMTRVVEGASPKSAFEIPRAQIQLIDSTEHLGDVVDSGRRRSFRRMNLAELDALQMDPAQVMQICKQHGLTGLCFYAAKSESEICLRVFTISLAGKEDAATGGAVAGLAVLVPRGSWIVRQGSGGPLTRGELHLDSQTQEQIISVGGRVEFVAKGSLV
ncbi:MAG: PhzF family phenazine biosynthesis protein [Leptospirales bacterium]|nr:PhzF family phenazine biosynthesis protein [Leptospirales bacterium]